MRRPGGSAVRSGGCGWPPEVLATVFVIRDSRKREVAIEILGAEPSGVVVTDRYTVYLFVAMDRHQVCLAHLMHDIL